MVVNTATEKSLIKYRLRAECGHDVLEFQKLAQNKIQNLESARLADCPGDRLVTFESALSVDELVAILFRGSDMHVMYQTLQPIEKYTGERNYSLNP